MSEPTPEELSYRQREKRLVRKIDIRIMPMICTAYLLNYIDRTNLGNARTLNNDANDGSSMNEMLNITPHRYSIVVAVFFIPYILLEFPCNYILKRWGPKAMISRICFGWGVVTMCTAACTSYGGLIACRLALAAAEAGFFPGVLLYFCFWYTPLERGKRLALFLGFTSVAGGVGGLIATACSYLNHVGGLRGWQWLYILEGIPAVLFGVYLAFFLPNFPDDAKFLSMEERTFAIERLGAHAPKTSDKHVVWSEVRKTVLSLDFWLFAMIYWCVNTGTSVLVYFGPTLIASLGFTGAAGQALIIPPNALGFVLTLANAWWSDKRKRRPEHVLLGICVMTLGFILMVAIPARPDTVPGRYIGILLIACSGVATAPYLAYRSSTVSGTTATSVANVGVASMANVAGITTPFVFNGDFAPDYRPSLWVSVGLTFIAALCISALWYRLGAGAEYDNTRLVTTEKRTDVDLDKKGDAEGDDVQAFKTVADEDKESKGAAVMDVQAVTTVPR